MLLYYGRLQADCVPTSETSERAQGVAGVAQEDFHSLQFSIIYSGFCTSALSDGDAAIVGRVGRFNIMLTNVRKPESR